MYAHQSLSQGKFMRSWQFLKIQQRKFDMKEAGESEVERRAPKSVCRARAFAFEMRGLLLFQDKPTCEPPPKRGKTKIKRSGLFNAASHSCESKRNFPLRPTTTLLLTEGIPREISRVWNRRRHLIVASLPCFSLVLCENNSKVILQSMTTIHFAVDDR